MDGERSLPAPTDIMYTLVTSQCNANAEFPPRFAALATLFRLSATFPALHTSLGGLACHSPREMRIKTQLEWYFKVVNGRGLEQLGRGGGLSIVLLV